VWVRVLRGPPNLKHESEFAMDDMTTAMNKLDKYPQLIDYGYIREIGGEPTFKVMIGTVGKAIR
jgi:hypothetical protein